MYTRSDHIYFSYVSIASLIVALIAQIGIITEVELAHITLLNLLALAIVAFKSFDLGVEASEQLNPRKKVLYTPFQLPPIKKAF